MEDANSELRFMVIPEDWLEEETIRRRKGGGGRREEEKGEDNGCNDIYYSVWKKEKDLLLWNVPVPARPSGVIGLEARYNTQFHLRFSLTLQRTHCLLYKYQPA
jgi:hypothetical protein